jgi:hypothetical protein
MSRWGWITVLELFLMAASRPASSKLIRNLSLDDDVLKCSTASMAGFVTELYFSADSSVSKISARQIAVEYWQMFLANKPDHLAFKPIGISGKDDCQTYHDYCIEASLLHRLDSPRWIYIKGLPPGNSPAVLLEFKLIDTTKWDRTPRLKIGRIRAKELAAETFSPAQAARFEYYPENEPFLHSNLCGKSVALVWRVFALERHEDSPKSRLQRELERRSILIDAESGENCGPESR